MFFKRGCLLKVNQLLEAPKIREGLGRNKGLRTDFGTQFSHAHLRANRMECASVGQERCRECLLRRNEDIMMLRRSTG